MELKYSLRPATTEDLDKVIEIEGKCYSTPWTSEHFKEELVKPYSEFLVLTDDETDTEIAGYFVAWWLFDECHLLNLAVGNEYRGLGYAKHMMTKLANLSQRKGVQKIVLEVRKSNMPAIQLYQSFGFDITHVRKRFYSDGEDAYQMVVEIQSESLE